MTTIQGSNGAIAVIDEDGGSSPAFVVSLLNGAGSGPEQCPNCHKAAGRCICTTDEVEHALALDIDGLRRLTAQWIETLQTQGRALDTTRAHVRLLQAQVADNGTTILELAARTLQLEKRFLSLEGVAESTQATAAETRSNLAALADRVAQLELARVAETAED